MHELLRKWQHIAHTESTNPGSYFRVLVKAEQITQTDHDPDAVATEQMHELIRQRLGS